jgi:hypothetical protein
MLSEQNLMMLAVASAILAFVLSKNSHQQGADKYDIVGSLGIDTSSSEVKYFMMALPFIYALKDELGLGPIFAQIGLSSSSPIVQI